ncbi:hypothetical protein [Pseudomonas fluorescens]|uniref:Class II aldolase n=1 Tax=Pseudomonas fluorescens TaxID=294 RepID=A0A5E7BCU2_PSEFL|nr:hypothetical protein [Pseudomonas fluorescens]VVN86354.1 hypothetical protein PS710_01528 [Pseudomonas fluorescens]
MSVTPVQSPSSVKDQVSAAEWQTRVDLTACYRLVAQHGWDDLIFTHISAKVQNGGAELIAIEPQILAGAKAMIAGVTKSAQGMGGALARPALLRKLDKLDPGYKL